MKIQLLSVLFILTFIGVVSCTNMNLPESFGYYACTDKALIPINSQKIDLVGNISGCITGIKGTSGTQVDSLKYFIVYEKNLNIKTVSIVKLHFKQTGMVQNIIGSTPVEVNLWSTAENVDFDVSPIAKKPDMYKLTPKSPIKPGFYAIHTGVLNTSSTIDAAMDRDHNKIYDIVVGESVEKYKSSESKKQEKEASIAIEAQNLLQSFNSHFNAVDCNNLKEIYMPQGKALAGNELKEYCTGISSWLNKSGKITKSDIVGSDVTGDSGTFNVATTYEKTGVQNEKFVITKISGRYRIISFE